LNSCGGALRVGQRFSKARLLVGQSLIRRTLPSNRINNLASNTSSHITPKRKARV
jgi:hypothetical protein